MTTWTARTSIKQQINYSSVNKRILTTQIDQKKTKNKTEQIV